MWSNRLRADSQLDCRIPSLSRLALKDKISKKCWIDRYTYLPTERLGSRAMLYG